MDYVQAIIQAGAVGVALYTIYTMGKLVGNHLEHNTSAISELTKAIAELKEWLKDNRREI